MEFLVSLGFVRLMSDSAIFVKAGYLVVLVHVDDLIAIGSLEARNEIVGQLRAMFSLKHVHWLDKMGDACTFVGKTLEKTAKGFSVAVPAGYVDKMAELVNLVGAKASRIPISKVAPLMADGVTCRRGLPLLVQDSGWHAYLDEL